MEISIGMKIKYLRENKKISQSQLSCEILSRTTLSKIENDRMLPSIPQLKHIAGKLNVSVSYFFDKNSLQTVSHLSQLKTVENMELYSLYSNNNYFKIVDEFEDGKLDNNDDVNKYFYIGMSYYYHKKYKNSVINLRKYIRLYSGYKEDTKIKLAEEYAVSLNTLCKIMIENNGYNKALSYLYQARKTLEGYELQKKSIYFIIIANIGSMLLMRNRYERIIELLENFLLKNANLVYTGIAAAIHLLLNISYYNLGEYDKSIEHVKKAIFLYSYSNCETKAIESYLNYVNAFRYNNQFDEAFRILNNYKNLCSDKKSRYLDNRFLMQEMTLYFNLKNYDKVISISRSIKIPELTDVSKANYYFMIGHINFERKNLNLSCMQLIKCEKHFIKKNYGYDLFILYSDLYEISGKNEYKLEMDFYKNNKGAKNIWCT